jgi:hypothetical protein
MNFKIRGTVGMEGQLWFWKPHMGAYLTTHIRALLEKQVSEERRKTASTPSPMPKARSSVPLPASMVAQKAIKSFNSLL